MRRLLVLAIVGIATALAFPAARAATTPPGVNLRWDACYGDGGALNKRFACDTNAGSDRLVGSFELAQPMAQVFGIEMYIDLGAAAATLPAWWEYFNVSRCRVTSMSISGTPPAGSASCVDWGSGNVTANIATYQLAPHGPETARIFLLNAVALNQVADLAAGQEYFAFTLTFNHAKTVGLGSCAGCTTPVCIFFSRIVVAQVGSDVGTELYQGANGTQSQYVTWQNATPTNVGVVCDFPSEFCTRHYTSFTCVDNTTGVGRSTWGSVKSLYR